MYEISCKNCEFFVNIFGYEKEVREICEIHSKINNHTVEYVKIKVYPHKTVRLERHTTNVEQVTREECIKIIGEDKECKNILMKGTDNFGMIFDTCLRPKDSKFPNFSV